MNTTNSRIIYLWQQFSARQATRAELDELMELLSSGSHDEESRQYLQQLLATTAPGEEDPARWEPILQSILHPVRTMEPSSSPSPIRRWVRRTMAAAAAILLLVGLTRLWHSYRQDQEPAKPVVVVAPGSNKAVLTLAGGQKIILDSAATGVLAEQGGTRVQKLANGQLAYEAEGAKGTNKPLYNTLTTPRGGQYQLTLPDGTKVWLNAASSITYPIVFTGKSRVVQMTGEAYFEVAHDQKRSFAVMTDGQVVQDIGTHFNINAYADEPNQVTTLLEGAVIVNGRPLRPGEKASTVTGAKDIQVSKGDPDQAVAWKNGLFNFNDAGLQTVMRQLSRWYNVDVTYEGNIPPRQFTGMIGRSLTLNQVLKGLATERVHYEIKEGNKLIITP